MLAKRLTFVPKIQYRADELIKKLKKCKWYLVAVGQHHLEAVLQITDDDPSLIVADVRLLRPINEKHFIKSKSSQCNEIREQP